MQLIAHIGEWEQLKGITKDWTGIVFYPEKNTTWQNAENDKAQQQALQKNIFSTIGIAIGLGLFAYTASLTSSVALLAFGLFSLIGLVIAFFILAAELGYQNTIVKQVCGAVSAGGCEKVLNSKQAKSFLGFTPADLGLIYFATQFALFLATPLLPALVPVLYAVAFGGIVIAAWSIYTQAVILKNYCALCLALVTVLLAQMTIAIFNFSSSSFYLAPLAYVAILFTSLALILFPIKALLNTNEQHKRKVKELRKWQTDVTIFKALAAEEQQVDTTIWENDLILGNPNAPILITVACNPYCGPCAKAHKLLDALLEQYPNELAVQIRLICNPADLTESRTIATSAILQQAAIIKDNRKLKAMLTDWFHLMDLEKWNAVWKTDTTFDLAEKLEAHNNWNMAAEIKFTPSFFINGEALPSKYSIEDIKKIIPELAMCQKEMILQ